MRESILTDRLRLRDLTLDDAVLLLELDSDPEVMRYIGIRPGLGLDAYLNRTRTVFLPMQEHPWHGVRVVEDRQTSDFLGWTFIRPAPGHLFARELGWGQFDEIEVGYRFRRACWGQGFATESSRVLVDLARADAAVSAIVACALRPNVASLRVLEKLGLSHDGEVTVSGFAEPLVRMRQSMNR